MTQVGIKPFCFQHDEEGPPAQQDSREEQVLDDGRECHPPAPAMGSSKRGCHCCVGRWPRSESQPAGTRTIPSESADTAHAAQRAQKSIILEEISLPERKQTRLLNVKHSGVKLVSAGTSLPSYPVG